MLEAVALSYIDLAAANGWVLTCMSHVPSGHYSLVAPVRCICVEPKQPNDQGLFLQRHSSADDASQPTHSLVGLNTETTNAAQ